MKVTKACLSCNTPYESYPSQNKQFCSRNCLYAFNKTEEGVKLKSTKIQKTKESKGTSGQEHRTCKNCNTRYTALKSETRSFCSKSCRYDHISKNKDAMLEKQHNTNIAKYGYAFPTQNKEIIQSIRQSGR